MYEPEMGRNAVLELLCIRQTIENIQHRFKLPSLLLVTLIYVIYGVSRRGEQEPGIVHRRGHLLNCLLDSRSRKSKYILLLERKWTIHNIIEWFHELQPLLHLFLCFDLLVARDDDFELFENAFLPGDECHWNVILLLRLWSIGTRMFFLDL